MSEDLLKRLDALIVKMCECLTTYYDPQVEVRRSMKWTTEKKLKEVAEWLCMPEYQDDPQKLITESEETLKEEEEMWRDEA